MAEMMGGSQNTPTPKLMEVYNHWGKGGWGAVLTG